MQAFLKPLFGLRNISSCLQKMTLLRENIYMSLCCLFLYTDFEAQSHFILQKVFFSQREFILYLFENALREKYR